MDSKHALLKVAVFLAVITVFYNLVEGVVSVFLGLEDETLALFGFGLDSFVEVISGIGIWHMVVRMKTSQDGERDAFEKRALGITGTAFYLLAAGLLASSLHNLAQGTQPETTVWGVVIAAVSISVMGWLVLQKRKVGTSLSSDAILADANCTRTCMQLSFVLLVASLGYEVLGIGRLDALGALIIAGISFREGKEAFTKARNRDTCCD